MDQQAGLTFTLFLEKMRDPAAADLVRNIKSFIRQFEERAPGMCVDPAVDSASVQAFLAQSEQLFRQHPVWRGCAPEVLDQAVEGLEKYVMSKVWRQTFSVWPEDRERDERYQRLMQALSFVDLPALMGAAVEPDANLLTMAQGELLKMDRYKAPRDKLLCLVNVKTMVENVVQMAAKGGANIGGADAFFPVFLLVLIRARPPHLAGNVEYIKRFRSAARLSGQFDFMLCNLESAAVYLDTVSYEHLAVSRDTFLAHLAAAGIPEADMELRRMQQQQQQQPKQQSLPRPLPAAGELASVAAEAGNLEEGARKPASGTQGSVTAGLADLQLIERSADSTQVAAVEVGTPATPAAHAAGGDLRGSGLTSGLTPLAEPAAPSPVLMGAPDGGSGAGPVQPRELLFEGGTPQQARHAAVWRERPPLHAQVDPLVEAMVAEGTRYVLAAEAAGELQQHYPYMYARAEDLSLGDVLAVLAGYKELLLRYEALSRSLQQQLGLRGHGSGPRALAASLADEHGGAAVDATRTACGQQHEHEEQQQHRRLPSDGLEIDAPPPSSALCASGTTQAGRLPDTADLLQLDRAESGAAEAARPGDVPTSETELAPALDAAHALDMLPHADTRSAAGAQATPADSLV